MPVEILHVLIVQQERLSFGSSAGNRVIVLSAKKRIRSLDGDKLNSWRQQDQLFDVRPFNGSARIWVWSTRFEIAAEVVSTCGTSTSTVIVVLVDPTCKVKSTTSWLPTLRVIPL